MTFGDVKRLSSDLQVVLLLGYIRTCLTVMFFCVGLIHRPCCQKQIMNE